MDSDRAVLPDDAVGKLFRLSQDVLRSGRRLQLDRGRLLPEMDGDGGELAGAQECLGQDVLPRVLRHEVPAARSVHGAVDRTRGKRRIHDMHDLSVTVFQLDHSRPIERAAVRRLPSAAGEEARAVQDDLMQRAARVVLEDGSVELEEGWILVEQFFRHRYGIAGFRNS
jgi:hypothetical protein